MRCVCVYPWECCAAIVSLHWGTRFRCDFMLWMCVYLWVHAYTHTHAGYIKTVPGHSLFNSSCQPSDGLLVSTATVPALPFDLAWSHSGFTRSRPLSPSLCLSLLSKQKRGHCHHRNDTSHLEPLPSLKLCRLLFMLHALTWCVHTPKLAAYMCVQQLDAYATLLNPRLFKPSLVGRVERVCVGWRVCRVCNRSLGLMAAALTRLLC